MVLSCSICNFNIFHFNSKQSPFSIRSTTKNNNKQKRTHTHTHALKKERSEINKKAANKLHLARADCFVRAVSFKAIAWLAFVNKYLYMALAITAAL